jgi:replicative DNA helicase
VTAPAEVDGYEDEFDRTPPHDLAAEQSVLGGMLLSRDAVADVAGIITGRDFYRPQHTLVHDVIVDLLREGQPADAVTVAAELTRRGDIGRMGGATYLHTLVHSVPTAAMAAHYARIVRERAILRRLIEVSTRSVQSAYEHPGDPQDLVYLARADLDALLAEHDTAGALELMPDLIERTLGELTEAMVEMPGLKTGFADLDALLAGGVHPGQLVIIAARPAVGKTNAAMDFARSFAVRRGHPTLFFSLEMSRDEIIRGMLAAESGVEFQKFRTNALGPADWARVYPVLPRMVEAPLFIDDSPHVGLDEMLRRWEELARDPGTRPQVIILDYVQLMKSARRVENRQQEVSAFARGLKLLAKRLGIPVIALAQLNRGPEQRSDKRPQLSDLRESGALEQDADVVILLHRDDMHEQESPRAGEADFIVAKQRNGPTSTITVAFQGHYRRFVDMAPDYLNEPHYQSGYPGNRDS